MALNPRFARPIVLLLASVCGAFSAVAYVFETLIVVLVFSLAIFPLGLAWLWYALGDVPESKGYGVSALLATAASMNLALSTLVGPLTPVVAGLLLLGFLKRDAVLYFAAVASLSAIVLGDGGRLLTLAAANSSSGAPGFAVFGVLTLGLLLSTLIEFGRGGPDSPAPDSQRLVGAESDEEAMHRQPRGEMS